ncbi:MAG: hypothetical protein INR71_03035 [Terriglobus roseus]|nr:hypothetical protein [Terriglobus roseus]
MYKGTNPKTGGSILLRSYDSKRESQVEPEITIWQAGRATAAAALAFKPIQVGQSVFLDEGAAKYNPAPQILDEAVLNEWPGREVGIFVSIGTGRRKKVANEPDHLWFEGLLGHGMDSFAEARRRLVQKIDGCEETHQAMLRQHLPDHHVSPENYYRLNVEVGVGEFGMNEWSRLADISTNTRRYLSKSDVQGMNFSAASKLAKIHFAKVRWERQLNGEPEPANRWDLPSQQQQQQQQAYVPPPADPLAVELPAEDVPAQQISNVQRQEQLLSPHYHRRPSEDEKFMIVPSDDHARPVSADSNMPPQNAANLPFRPSMDSFQPSHGAVSPYGHSPAVSVHSIYAPQQQQQPLPRRSGEHQRMTPPPLPPKTPLNMPQGMQANLTRPPGGVILPYPDNDGPPPVVNMARKPNLS